MVLVWIIHLSLMDLLEVRIRGNIHGGSLGGNLRFYTTDDTQTLQQRAIFDKNGRFGINVASPTKTLDVGGNAKISGDLEVTGSHGLSSKIYPSKDNFFWISNRNPKSEWKNCNGHNYICERNRFPPNRRLFGIRNNFNICGKFCKWCRNFCSLLTNLKMKTYKEFKEEWSNKYKKSINCSNPKGFSQKELIVLQEIKKSKR